MESGTDATQDLSFWTTTSVTSTAAITSDSSIFYTGTRSIKLTNGGTSTSNANLTVNSVLADAGRRISFRFRTSTLPTSSSTAIVQIRDSAGNQVMTLQLATTGTLNLAPVGATTVVGTTVLSINTWYRITLSYTITNTTTFKFQDYVNGIFESTATAGTLTRTGSDRFQFTLNGGGGILPANTSFYYDDIYVDDGSDYTDPGNIRVTAKRPNANGTTNNFVTQIGAGGSGYGSGHSPQVNEQPLSATNGWSVVAVGSAVTEEYNIEGKAIGDVDISSTTIVDVAGWVYTKALVAETGQIVLNGTTPNISITTSNALFEVYAGSTAYPDGTGTDIGEVTDTTVTTVSLFECGVLVAYKPYNGAFFLSQ